MRSFLVQTLPDGSVWPIPGVMLDETEERLRYGDPVVVRALAASVVAAYRALLEMPECKRRVVIREIRKLVKEREP